MADEPNNENEQQVVEENDAQTPENDVEVGVEATEGLVEEVVAPPPEKSSIRRSQIKSVVESSPPEMLQNIFQADRIEVVQKFIEDDLEAEPDGVRSKLTITGSESERLNKELGNLNEAPATSTPRESSIKRPSSRASGALPPRSSSASKRLSFEPSTSKEVIEPAKSVTLVENLSQKSSARESVVSTKELNEATQKAIVMHQMIEEKTKRIEGLKARYNNLNAKTCKTENDVKHIKMLKCEIDCSFKRLEAHLKELKHLQKDVQDYSFPQIRLPTTIAEDSAPNVLGVQTHKFEFLKPESCSIGKRCSQPNFDTCQELAEENLTLTAERRKHQGEILERDQIIENLQQNIRCLQLEMESMRKEKGDRFHKKVMMISKSSIVNSLFRCHCNNQRMLINEM